jgi:hypothetical protein
MLANVLRAFCVQHDNQRDDPTTPTQPLNRPTSQAGTIGATSTKTPEFIAALAAMARRGK